MKSQLIITYMLIVNIAFAQDEVTGPYFGKTPPGNTPVLFAPEVLTVPEGDITVSRIAFSPDGNECFFSGYLTGFAGTKMYYIKCENNVWSSPEEVIFIPEYSCRQPQFSKSGDTLYFSSRKNGTFDIWMVERSEEGWGNPQVLPAPINTDTTQDAMFTVAPDGTFYIESSRPGTDPSCETSPDRRRSRSLSNALQRSPWASPAFCIRGHSSYRAHRRSDVQAARRCG